MKSSTNPIPVVLTFTSNYYVYAATTMYSILKHSDEGDRFDMFCLVPEALPSRTEYLLRRLECERLHITLQIVGKGGKTAGITHERFVVLCYRLLLSDLLPDHDKVLYIDCDVIVRNNLATLYRSVDLGNNYLAGVFEACLDFQIPYLSSIGCRAGEYFNAGFLLMNLRKLREDSMSSTFIEALKERDYMFFDQDVLNRMCKGKIVALPPIWNAIRTFFIPQYKAEFLKYYSLSDWEEVQNHGNIHYTCAKPWDARTVRFSNWWEIYEELPEEIKAEKVPGYKMYMLYRIGRLPGVSSIISAVCWLYRLRYR